MLRRGISLVPSKIVSMFERHAEKLVLVFMKSANPRMGGTDLLDSFGLVLNLRRNLARTPPAVECGVATGRRQSMPGESGHDLLSQRGETPTAG
jgi:hypothetical protein